jgi:hypothetical protein
MHTLFFALLTLIAFSACGGDDSTPADTGGGDTTIDSATGDAAPDTGGADAPADTGSTDTGTTDGAADTGSTDAAPDTGDASIPPGECVEDATLCTETCLRPYSCVTVCGGPAVDCGCCPCAAGSIDDITCP